MQTITTIINALGYELPVAPKPGGNYMSVNVRQNIAYIAIQLPKLGDDWIFKGRIGQELTSEDGYKAFQLCALNVLAHIEKSIGLDKLAGLNHMDAYYQAAGNWDEGPKVVDGASDLFVKVLGDRGVHSRAIFGVDRMPRNFSAGITCSLTLNS